MKIIYLAFCSKDALGVRNKIVKQSDSWKKEGHDVEVVFDKGNGIYKYFFRYLTLLRLMLSRGSVAIYLRQLSFLPFASLMLKRTNYIYEVNAYLPLEIKTYSPWKRLVMRFFSDTNLVKNAKFRVYISKELKNLYQDTDKHFAFICPNSISKLPTTIDKSRRLDTLQIVFVGNENQAWQGVDIVKDLARRLQMYHFHFIGSISPDKTIENATFHSILRGDSYTRIMSEMDVGIASMGFTRSGLSEASPLKSRDYISNDIPFVAGYIDSEFNEFGFCQFLRDPLEMKTRDLEKLFHQLSNNRPSSYNLNEYLFENKERKKIRTIFESIE